MNPELYRLLAMPEISFNSSCFNLASRSALNNVSEQLTSRGSVAMSSATLSRRFIAINLLVRIFHRLLNIFHDVARILCHHEVMFQNRNLPLRPGFYFGIISFLSFLLKFI